MHLYSKALLFGMMVVLLAQREAEAYHHRHLAFAARSGGSYDIKAKSLKQRAVKTQTPASIAKHSTERLEEPGRHRNYGTEFTKPKRRQVQKEENEAPEEQRGRAWSFGKVNWW